jgi:hypothetical protein
VKVFIGLTVVMFSVLMLLVSFKIGQYYERRVNEPHWKEALVSTYWDGFGDAESMCLRRLYVMEGQI